MLYDILKRSEESLFERIEAQTQCSQDPKERAIAAIREIYLAPDSIIRYVTPTDYENLLTKLPNKIYTAEKAKSQDYFSRILALFEIDNANCDMQVLGQLMDALSFPLPLFDCPIPHIFMIGTAPLGLEISDN